MLNADLVFEGGGMKGIGLVGGLAVLEERGYTAQRRAGSSAGAIVAALHAAGYSAAELYETLLELDFTDFLDKDWVDRIPVAGVPLSIALELGIYEGDAFEKWMAEKLAAKGVHTFADMRRDDAGDDRRFQHKLQVVVSDTTTHEMLVLPRDAEEKLGIDPDTLSVAAAVRASMSIPVYFEPKRMTDPRDGREHVLVDGGMLSNFPVWIFDAEKPRWPTFGLMLVETSSRSPLSGGVTTTAITGVCSIPAVGFVIALAETMLEAHDRLYLEEADFVRTITIETLGVGVMEFGLARERKEALYERGREAAEEVLRDFDFDAYVAAFRAEHPSRRDSVRAAMRDASA